MDVKLINPFINATLNVIETMAFLNPAAVGLNVTSKVPDSFLPNLVRLWPTKNSGESALMLTIIISPLFSIFLSEKTWLSILPAETLTYFVKSSIAGMFDPSWAISIPLP